MASAVDDEEFTIVTIDEAFAFKIPPQSSASGHKYVHVVHCASSTAQLAQVQLFLY